MIRILSDRIEQGVRNFFKALMLTEPIKSGDIKNIYIFFAGNASKSPLVKNIFYKYINEHFGGECSKLGIDVMDTRRFRIFPPLGSNDAERLQNEYGAEMIRGITAPTGKTGVVRGLLDNTILVIDSVKEHGVEFGFFLGVNRRGKFDPVIRAGADREKWQEFIDACDNSIMLYYTSLPECNDGTMHINRAKLKKIVIKQTSDDEDVNVYIRPLNANAIEYCVARESELKDSKYICEPVKITLD